jgi:hypothetical protein
MRRLHALTTWALSAFLCCVSLRLRTTPAMTESVPRRSSSLDLVKSLHGNVPHAVDDRALSAVPITTAQPTLSPSSLSTVPNPMTTNPSSSLSTFQAVFRWALLVPILSLTIMMWAVRKHFGGLATSEGLWCCLEGPAMMSTDPKIPDEIIVNDEGQEGSVASTLGNHRNVHFDVELPAWSSSRAILTPCLHNNPSPAGLCEAPSDEEESASCASIFEGQDEGRPRSVVAKSSSSASLCSLDNNLALSCQYVRMNGHA